MAKILILTADSFFEVAMRLECLAEGLDGYSDSEAIGADAALVDLDGISIERLTLAQTLVRNGLPILCIRGAPSTVAALGIPARTCIPNSVEAGRLVYLLQKMVRRKAARRGNPIYSAPASHESATSVLHIGGRERDQAA